MSEENAPFSPSDDSAIIALQKHWGTQRNRRIHMAAQPGSYSIQGTDVVWDPPTAPDPKDSLPTLLAQTLIVPESKTAEGVLIASIALPWRRILKLITEDPSLMYQIDDSRRWEEIIAASYQESGLFDEVILTPRSNDGGKDVIAVRKGYGSIRFVESVKKYKPGNEVTADDVRALGFLLSDPKNSKGIVSTTWKFAPRIEEDPLIKQYIPYRLELVDGEKLIERFRLWGKLGEGKP